MAAAGILTWLVCLSVCLFVQAHVLALKWLVEERNGPIPGLLLRAVRAVLLLSSSSGFTRQQDAHLPDVLFAGMTAQMLKTNETFGEAVRESLVELFDTLLAARKGRHAAWRNTKIWEGCLIFAKVSVWRLREGEARERRC